MIEATRYAQDVLEISRRMLLLADQEKEGGDEDGGVELDGVLRDCAFRVRAAAEKRRSEISALKVRSDHEAANGR